MIDELKKINPKVVFDIGSNNGSWTREMKSHLRNSTFYTFEANVLLSSDEREIEFYSIAGTGDSYYRENTKHYQSVKPTKMPSRRLDNIIEQDNLTPPDFIKLDTQGSELDILEGLGEYIKGVKCILTEVSFFNYNQGSPKINDYIEFFQENGFYPVSVEQVHKCDNIVVQLDLFFMRKDIKETIYGDKGVFKL
jgi:hypothetical protein